MCDVARHRQKLSLVERTHAIRQLCYRLSDSCKSAPPRHHHRRIRCRRIGRSCPAKPAALRLRLVAAWRRTHIVSLSCCAGRKCSLNPHINDVLWQNITTERRQLLHNEYTSLGKAGAFVWRCRLHDEELPRHHMLAAPKDAETGYICAKSQTQKGSPDASKSEGLRHAADLESQIVLNNSSTRCPPACLRRSHTCWPVSSRLRLQPFSKFRPPAPS